MSTLAGSDAARQGSEPPAEPRFALEALAVREGPLPIRRDESASAWSPWWFRVLSGPELVALLAAVMAGAIAAYLTL